MKPTNRSLRLAMVLIAASAGMAACGSSNDAEIPPLVIPPPPPPPPPVVFSDYVKQQFAATADDTDPEPVDETDFAFDDQDDTDAFNDLLSP